MARIKDDAIVLRKLDYAETSQVLAAFTRSHGKVRFIAKGVKRSTKTRFAPGIDLLDIGKLVVSIRTPRQEALAILTEWSQTRSFNGLRGRLDRLYGAQYAAAITAALTEDWDPHPGLFDAFETLLSEIEQSVATLPQLVSFQRSLLLAVGSIPETDSCVGCRRPVTTGSNVYFSATDGGLVCRDCEMARPEKISVKPSALPWLRGPVQNHDAGDSKDDDGARTAWRILDYHIAHLLGRPLPLAAMYLNCC